MPARLRPDATNSRGMRFALKMAGGWRATSDDANVVVPLMVNSMSEERFSRIEAKIDDLGHQMRLLHEDLVGRIAALAPDYDLIDRRIAAADTKLREELLTRIEPLEAVERARHRG